MWLEWLKPWNWNPEWKDVGVEKLEHNANKTIEILGWLGAQHWYVIKVVKEPLLRVAHQGIVILLAYLLVESSLAEHLIWAIGKGVFCVTIVERFM